MIILFCGSTWSFCVFLSGFGLQPYAEQDTTKRVCQLNDTTNLECSLWEKKKQGGTKGVQPITSMNIGVSRDE